MVGCREPRIGGSRRGQGQVDVAVAPVLRSRSEEDGMTAIVVPGRGSSEIVVGPEGCLAVESGRRVNAIDLSEADHGVDWRGPPVEAAAKGPHENASVLVAKGAVEKEIASRIERDEAVEYVAYEQERKRKLKRGPK